METTERPRKRKKADKHKKKKLSKVELTCPCPDSNGLSSSPSKAKVSPPAPPVEAAPPAPPVGVAVPPPPTEGPPPHSEASPPLPACGSTGSVVVGTLLTTNANDSGDSELDLSSLMSAHEAVEDCVLPTVPSLSDMLSQSDICSSIASAGSSLEDGECNSRDLVICTDPEEMQDDTVTPVTTEVKVDLATAEVNSIESVSASPCADMKPPLPLLPTIRQAAATDDQTSSTESTIATDKSSTADNSMESDQASLDAHAHELLESTSSASITSESQNATESTSTESVKPEYNAEGYILKTRNIVRDVVPKSQFEALPEGWKELTHDSGMSIYCHLPTRVVTWARPYHLNDRYAKSHDVPVGAIPCLIYKKCSDLAKECVDAAPVADGKVAGCPLQNAADEKLKVGSDHDVTSIVSKQTENPAVGEGSEDGEPKPPTDKDPSPLASKLPDLSMVDFLEYCRPVFQFETKEFKKFDSWKQRKDYTKRCKADNNIKQAHAGNKQTVIVPVYELPVQYQRDERGKLKSDFHSILGTHTAMDLYYNFVQWAWKAVPAIDCSPCDAGFNCNLRIRGGDTIYGSGQGSTKKQAKTAAARVAMEALLPNYAPQLLKNALVFGDKEKMETGLADYYKIFDNMPITDERVASTAKQSNQVYPLAILKICIARNLAMPDTAIKSDVTVERKGAHVHIECNMTIGQYSVKGIKGKNSKVATNIAAQHILQQIHPHLQYWGSLLRMYGKFSEGSAIDLSHQSAAQLQVTQLQTANSKETRARDQSSPTVEASDKVLVKLKADMMLLYQKKPQSNCPPAGNIIISVGNG